MKVGLTGDESPGYTTTPDKSDLAGLIWRCGEARRFIFGDHQIASMLFGLTGLGECANLVGGNGKWRVVMVLLQSKDEFDQLVELDRLTGQLTWHSKRANPDMVARSICGSISRLQGRLMALYADVDRLHFWIDTEDFVLTDDVVAEFRRLQDDSNHIRLLCDRTVLFDWIYQRPVIGPPLEVDPTAFVDEEDFDFGLFVFNVMNDTARRARLRTKKC